MGIKFDEIGYWSEIKLDIIKEYAAAYSTIMRRQPAIKAYYYVDAFAGAGIHISKTTGQPILGSPMNALRIAPPFTAYYFIDLDGAKVDVLRQLAKGYPNTHIYEGDCNPILRDELLPQIQFGQYRRALCVLDPYGLHLDWDVIYLAGQSGAVEVFLNFPVMDMNMNILWTSPDRADREQITRMNRFWGDESWRKAAYTKSQGLFEVIEEKNPNDTVAEAFRQRLKETAGFKYVPSPIPMRNSRGATVYYLFFAGRNETGAKIVRDIFTKYKDRGVQ
jgi:three-Cys-motif partner protein